MSVNTKFVNRNSSMINQIRNFDNKNFNHFDKLQNVKKKIDNADFKDRCLIELNNMKILLQSNYFNEYQYSNISILLKSLEYIFNNIKYSILFSKFYKMCQKVDLLNDSISFIFTTIKEDIVDILSYIYSNYFSNLPKNILNEISDLKCKIKIYNKLKSYDRILEQDLSSIDIDIDMIERCLKYIEEDSSSSETDSDNDLNTFDKIDCDIKKNMTNDLSEYENDESELDYLEEDIDNNNSVNENEQKSNNNIKC